MNDVTRSTEATSAVSASYAARRRRAQPSGWWGVALLVATEAALFGTLIASYFYLRFRTVDWPPGGIEAPDATLPLVLTGVLLATSVPMLLAARAARAGEARRTALWILLGLAVQAGYLGGQAALFASDLDKFSPKDNAYGSIYFTMLGAHHAHVVVGILLSLFVLARLISGLTNYRVIAVRVVALYWYFVAVVGVLVTLTQVSPSL
jgi:heme/copper-type cytochrome/quinol oxidase subunit 3